MKTCVYTVLLGGYDALLPQPTAESSDADFLCFTDDPNLTSDTWQIVLVEPRYPQDLHRSSRVYKILGHERLDAYDATLYVDASVLLKRDPVAIVEDWLSLGHDMALVEHSYREQVVDEFDEVVRLNYDDRGRVYEQLLDYADAYPDVLEAKPHWGGMLARRSSPAVAGAMRLWFDHVLRYSRRDQLSLMLALCHGGVNYRSIEIDNFDSELHTWPVIENRKVDKGKAQALASGPLLAEVRRAQRHADELAKELDERAREREELLAQLTRANEDREGSDARAAETDRMLREVQQQFWALQGVRAASRHLAKSLGDAVVRRARRR
ncbi:glycosyltransferase domain-containing protein [Microbacterium sediminicola]